jgi:hypothetical protein
MRRLWLVSLYTQPDAEHDTPRDRGSHIGVGNFTSMA